MTACPALRRLFCKSLLAAVFGLCAAVAALPAGGRPFVRVEGTRFMEGARPFYFVGTNLNVMHGPTVRGRAAATVAAAADDGLQVGRIWALGEDLERAPYWKRKHFLFRAGPDRWQPEAYEQLDRVIAEAGKRGLRLIVTLSNRWGDYGGIPMYLRWAGHVDVESYGYSDRFFTDAKCREWFAEHVRRIVGRTNGITKVPYKDDPTVMAWELQNEMSGTPEAAPVRRQWVVEMARMIRRIDPNHLIVPGTVGYNLEVERDNWIEMCKLREVAFCDQHIYPEEHLRSKGMVNLRRYIDDRVQLAHYVVGKPVIFGEFGFADRGRSGARAWRHKAFLERLFFDGGNGAMVWIYQPTLSWSRKFGVLIDKPRYRGLRRQLGRVARRVASQEVKNRNPLLGPARGRRPIAPTHVMLVRHRPPHRAWSRGAGGARTLRLPVDRFYRAWFEEAGSWDGGTLVHAYGRRTGWFEFRFTGPGFVADRLTIEARLSSEYPSKGAPPNGFSRVELSIDGRQLQILRAVPDDGLGAWYTVESTDQELLRRVRRGVHTLRLEVKKGPEANGVAIYGREAPLNREPVEEPRPLRITAYRGKP